ncbi:MAG: hypothetical protein AB1758_07035 [Candidatus Eremiobacterota bacterium]
MQRGGFWTAEAPELEYVGETGVVLVLSSAGERVRVAPVTQRPTFHWHLRLYREAAETLRGAVPPPDVEAHRARLREARERMMSGNDDEVSMNELDQLVRGREPTPTSTTWCSAPPMRFRQPGAWTSG